MVVLTTAAMDAVCSATVPVGTRLHWSTDSAESASVGCDGMTSVVDGKRRTKRNWTKTSHNTHVYACIISSPY